MLSFKGEDVGFINVSVQLREKVNLADEYPEIVEKIRNFMIESHTYNPYWDKNNKPLFNLQRACRDNGVSMMKK